MKILFLTPQPPYPLDQGTKLRNFHLLRIAAEGGHQVHLLSFGPIARSDAELARSELARWCSRIELVSPPPRRGPLIRARDSLRSSVPDLLRRLWSPAYLAALRRLVAEERYDAIQIEGLELAGYLAALPGQLTIFDDHNVEYLLQRRAYLTDRTQPVRSHAALYSLIQWWRLKHWERRVCRRAGAVLAVSARDAQIIAALSGRSVVNVPNGIDLAATPFRPPLTECPPDLLFDGTMSFRPNNDAALWFAREILPLVRERRPEVRFWVVGRDPRPELVRFNFASNGVAVTGAVPSTEPYWRRAGLYVLPMRMGSGIRFKTLEAMARGLPLVSTALGVEGLDAVSGRDYLLADQPRAFADAILRLLDDAELRRRLAASARQAVEPFDWARVAPSLLQVYSELAQRL
jgi:glycosyltransferase involved in cell wall biosynthesis